MEKKNNQDIELYSHTANFDTVRIAFYISRKGKRVRQVIAIDGYFINALASIEVSKQDAPQWVQAQVDDWIDFDAQLPITRQVKYLIMREVVKGLSCSDTVFYRTDEPNTMQGLKADSAKVKDEPLPTGKIESKEVTVYDNAALDADIAKLMRCKVGNRSKISNAKKPAKEALGLSKNCTSEENRAMFAWIKSNTVTK